MKAFVVVSISRSHPNDACLRRVGTFADHAEGTASSTAITPPRGEGRGRVQHGWKRLSPRRDDPDFG